ncbi:MAG TPA: hypothetical protein PKV82_11835 [Anaerolineae bacterium]|nr:hypothetical protein [Anaerolineae bacterium]
MKFKILNVGLALVLLFSGFAASAAPALASSGGGNQIFYPSVTGITETTLIGNNVWIAGEYSSSLTWANAETGRWTPQNRTALSVDSYGQNLWAVDGVVSLFDGNTWTTWSTWTAQAKGPASQIQVDITGHPWLLSSSAVSRYDGATWIRLVNGPDYPRWEIFRQIALVSANEAWVAYPKGLLHINGNVTKTFTTDDGLVSNNMKTVAYDSTSGTVWAGSQWSGISYGNTAGWTSITTMHGLLSNRIQKLDVGNGVTTWIAYEDVPGRISRYIPASGFMHLDLPPEYASEYVTHIQIQTPLTLWVGLRNGTLLKYVITGSSTGSWSVITSINGPAIYTTNRVFGVAGRVYSYGWQGASQFDGSTWQKIYDGFTTSAELGPNNYWLGTSNGNLRHSTDGVNWQVTYLGENVRVTHIVSDTQSSHLWLGTSSGLWKYDPVTRQVVNKWYPASAASTPGNYVKDLEVKPDGTIWLIACASADSAGKITQFNPTTNIWNTYQPEKLVTGLAQTSTGILWFSTEYRWTSQSPDGLLSFDGATWSVYTQTHGLPWSRVYDVAIDTADRVWTTGQAFGTAANNWESGSGFSVFERGGFTTYSLSFGVSSYAGLWLDQATGDLWVPTYWPEGVLRFNPNGLTSTAPILAGNTVIESQDGSGQAVFPPGTLPIGTEVKVVSSPAINANPLKGKSPVLEIDWDNSNLQVATAGTYTVTLSYIAPTLGLYVPSTFGLYHWNADMHIWQMMDSAIHNTTRMEFSAGVSAPGKFQIMGRTYDVFLPLTLRQ